MTKEQIKLFIRHGLWPKYQVNQPVLWQRDHDEGEQLRIIKTIIPSWTYQDDECYYVYDFTNGERGVEWELQEQA